MVTAAVEKVSERDKYMSQLRQFNSHVLKVIFFLPCSAYHTCGTFNNR